MPFAIKDRYLELRRRALSVLEARSEEEAEAVVASTIAHSRQLRMPSAEFCAHLMHAIHAYQAHDHAALRYTKAQSAQALAPDGIEPALEKAAAWLFLPVSLIAPDLPAISLDLIGAIVTAETALRAVTGMLTTPIAMAELARAAHLGQLAEIGPLREEVRARLDAEAGDVDTFDVHLDLARVLAPVDAGAVPGLVASVLEASNDPAQRRVALTWSVWAALLEGKSAGELATAVVAQLEEVDRDLEEFGDLPRSVLLEVAAQVPGALGGVVDAALADTTPGEPTHLDTFAGAARVMLDHAPADARGPRLREDAREIAAALDRLNGNSLQSELLSKRFFPEG